MRFAIQLAFIVSLIAVANSQCLVDKCASCTNTTENLCNTCERGWYLRRFTGGLKEYHECWSQTKLWLGIIGGLLGGLLLCAACYYCYLAGKKTKFPPGTFARDSLMTEPTQRDPYTNARVVTNPS